MSAKNKTTVLAFIIALSVLGCNLPGGAPPTQEASEENTATPTVTLTPTPVLSETPTAAIAADCKPSVTTSVVANIRSGPGQAYNIIGSLPQGGSANVAGKSTDGTWWYIEFPAGAGGFAWIAGSVTIPNCIPSTLASIVAPPLPVVAATDVPTEVAAEPAAPSATTVPGSGGPILVFPVKPGIFLINSPTPTKIKLQIDPNLLKPVQPILPISP